MSNNNYNNNNNRVMNKVTNKIKGTSTFVKVILVIILIVFVVLIIVWFITLLKNKTDYQKNNPIILSGEQDADTNTVSGESYNVSNLPLPINGNLYSFSLWIYIEDYTTKFGHYKNILVRTSDDNDNDPKTIQQSPGIYLDKNNPNLLTYTSIIGDENKSIECRIDNIPMNKWNHIVYVLNVNSIDLYINGKLEKSCILNGVPKASPVDPLYMCKNGGYNGKIAQVQYFTSALTPDKVLDLYNNGPSGTNKWSVAEDRLKNINYGQLKSQICSGDQSLSSIIKDNF